MMVIPVDLLVYMFGDDQFVLANTTRPQSALKRNSSSLVYHFVLEGVAKDKCQTTNLNTTYNSADMFLKSLSRGDK